MATDDDLFDDEDETETQATADNKDAIIQRLQKKAEKLEARIEKAREEGFASAKTTFEREQAAVKVAAELDLKPGLVTRFLKENLEADPTADALKAYAEELGVPVKTQDQGQTEATEEKAPPAAAAFHAGGGTASGGQKITYRQYREMVTAPGTHEEAIRLRQAGMVDENER